MIVFDSGPIISLTTSNLLWCLEELKKRSKGEFVIPGGVKRELIDRPLETRRFKFEAIEVQRLIDRKIVSLVDDPQVTRKAQALAELANSILSAQGQRIKIVQIGEMETIAAALMFKSNCIAVDERITRTPIENPSGLQKLMERRLHTSLKVDERALHQFTEETRHLSVLRSVELVTMAFEKGILDKFVVNLPNARRELLESVLWAGTLNGCSVTDEELDEIVKIESK